MANEATDQDQKLSSPCHQDGTSGLGAEHRGIKRSRPSAPDDDDDDGDVPGRERRKIEIKFITDKSRRHITFSKRKAGIMKKAYELSVLTGTQVLLLVVSETGLVYTFTTPKLQPLVTKPEGKNLIQYQAVFIFDGLLAIDSSFIIILAIACLACLNAPEPAPSNENGIDDNTVESPEETAHAAPVRPGGMSSNAMQSYAGIGSTGMTPEQAQALQYGYLRPGQGAAQYPMAPGGHMAAQPHAQ